MPRRPGVYAWYFRELPRDVPDLGCIRHSDLTLLYVGIAPKAPPQNGAAPSKERLSGRIRYHYRGNAEGSTLRLTLGCLLAGLLGIQLRRVGSGHRMTFADGEHILSDWMQRNAFVTWLEDERPWQMEQRLIATVSLPLNLNHNESHPFYGTLSNIRKAAKACARALPILP